MGTKPVNKTQVAVAVARNVRELRDRRGMSQAQLAGRLGLLGKPMQTTAIHKIEAGDRRVDVDDLVALAVALNVPPIRLLLPDSGADMDAEIELLPNLRVPAWTAWQWAAGEHHLHMGEPEANVARTARGGLAVGWDHDHVAQELSYVDSRPQWMRVGEGSELLDQLRDLTFKVGQALRYAPSPYSSTRSKADKAGWDGWLPRIGHAAKKIARTVEGLIEEGDDGSR